MKIISTILVPLLFWSSISFASPNQEAIRSLILRFEGISLKTYNDHGCGVQKRPEGGFYRPRCGYLTIGVGHLLTDKEINTGKVLISGKLVDITNGITKEQAYALFDQDIKIAKELLTRHVKTPLPDSLFVASVSYVFNCGNSALVKTRFKRFLNLGKFRKAVNEIDIVTSQGKVLKGLIKRRKIEREYALKDL